MADPTKTLLDEFAAAALSGVIMILGKTVRTEEHARKAYEIAEAMLTERAKRQAAAKAAPASPPPASPAATSPEPASEPPATKPSPKK